MKYEGGHASIIRSLAVMHDDSKLITGSDDHTCIIWNVLSGAKLNIFRGHTSWVRSVALSPCERYFASGSDDKTTRIGDIAKGELVHILTDHDNAVKDVTFSGRHTLLTASDDRTAIEYDISALLKDIPARFALLHCLRTIRNQTAATLPSVRRFEKGRKKKRKRGESSSDESDSRNLHLGASIKYAYDQRDSSEQRTRYLMCCLARDL